MRSNRHMKSNRPLMIIGIIAAVVLFSGAGWFAYVHIGGIDTQPASSLQPASQPAVKNDEQASAPRTVNLQWIKLFRPTEQGIVMAEKEIPNEPLAVRLAEAIVSEFLKQFPGGTEEPRLLGVYRDRNNVLYIDISSTIRVAAGGDARKEHDLLKALVLSLTANISAVQDVRLLIDGKETGTLAGHVSISGSLRQLALGGGPAAQGPK